MMGAPPYNPPPEKLFLSSTKLAVGEVRLTNDPQPNDPAYFWEETVEAFIAERLKPYKFHSYSSDQWWVKSLLKAFQCKALDDDARRSIMVALNFVAVATATKPELQSTLEELG